MPYYSKTRTGAYRHFANGGVGIKMIDSAYHIEKSAIKITFVEFFINILIQTFKVIKFRHICFPVTAFGAPIRHKTKPLYPPETPWDDWESGGQAS